MLFFYIDKHGYSYYTWQPERRVPFLQRIHYKESHVQRKPYLFLLRKIQITRQTFN